jgi:hypothetical protein
MSTSLFAIPPTVLQALNGEVIDQSAPPFSDRDVEEVLRAFNAPEAIASSVAKLINLLARQHPTLIVAACRYLERLGWKLEGEGFQGLFRGDHTADLTQEVHHKLQATVPDSTTRELLYRLTLAGGAFSVGDVDGLATVPPPIDGARERLRDITNSWIEQRPDGQFLISPLLNNVGRDTLDGVVRRECHLALANGIVSREELNLQTAFTTISHYHHAGEHGKSGSLLLMTLDQAQKHLDWIKNDILLQLWTNEPLPEGIDLNLRLAIRGLHILLFHKLGKSLDYLFADFDVLMSQATEHERFGAAGAVSYIVMGVGRKYPMQAGRWFRQFLKLPTPKAKRSSGRRKPRPTDQPELNLREDFPLHVFIWMLVGELTTTTHVSDWLDTVQALPTDILRHAFDVEVTDAHVGSIVVADSLTGMEQTKPKESRDWSAVVSTLTQFAARAWEMRVEVLWASFIRAKIIAQAEFCRDVDGALSTATQASNRSSLDPLVGFLIDGTIGRQLLLAKRYQDARFWLGRAVERKADAVFAYERANILLGASHAFGIEDAALGVKYATQATVVAESDAGVPPLDRVRAWSELGVSQFLAYGALAALPSWDRAGEYLFTMTDRNDFWKEQMVLFGHTSFFLAELAKTGKPPTQTIGGEPYAPPERGIFMTTNEARIAFFNENERNEGALWRTLAFFADAIGNVEIAKKWKARAAEVGKRDSLIALVAEAKKDQIPTILREQGYLATLEAGRESAQAFVISHHEISAGRSGIIREADIPAVLVQLSETEKLMTEDFGMYIGLIPCLLLVATRAAKVDARATAREEAERLIVACRTVGVKSFAPERWEQMADLIERAYILGHSSNQIVEWTNSCTASMSEGFNILVRLAASADATPTEAVLSMLPIMPRLCACWPPKSAGYKDLLMPFVVTYWTYMFEHRRFQFGRAMVVERQLPQAIAAPEEQRVVAVFRAIHAGFSFGQLPQDVRNWLFG